MRNGTRASTARTQRTERRERRERREKTRTSSRTSWILLQDQGNTGEHENYSRGAGDGRARWRNLLEKHDGREGCYPGKVHHACHEQECHDQPAAPRAEGTVRNSHAKCSGSAFTP